MAQSKNDVFLRALAQTSELELKSDGKLARETALNDLVKANPQTPDNFRTAIINKKEQWTALWTGDHKDVMKHKEQTSLEVPDDYFSPTSNKFLNPEVGPSFAEIHQEAVKQRILLGVKDADQDTLIGILTNNPGECRAYLASKAAFGPLTETIGWKETTTLAAVAPAVAKPINNSNTIVTDKTIDDVKKEAANLLLIQLINGNEGADLTPKLNSLSAATDSASVTKAAQALGFPAAPAINSLTYPLKNRVTAAINNRLTKLKEADAKASFAEQIGKYAQLSSQDQRPLLNAFIKLTPEKQRELMAKWYFLFSIPHLLLPTRVLC